MVIGARILFLTPNMSSDVRSQFSFFADHLSASMLNLFESISYQKVIFAQSWGHKEAIWTPEQPKYAHNSPFPEAESNKSPCILNASINVEMISMYVFILRALIKIHW